MRNFVLLMIGLVAFIAAGLTFTHRNLFRYFAYAPMDAMRWFIALALFFFGVYIVAIEMPRQILRERRRPMKSNRCPQCGYDCRATPQRCPECGTALLR